MHVPIPPEGRVVAVGCPVALKGKGQKAGVCSVACLVEFFSLGMGTGARLGLYSVWGCLVVTFSGGKVGGAHVAPAKLDPAAETEISHVTYVMLSWRCDAVRAAGGDVVQSRCAGLLVCVHITRL